MIARDHVARGAYERSPGGAILRTRLYLTNSGLINDRPCDNSGGGRKLRRRDRNARLPSMKIHQSRREDSRVTIERILRRHGQVLPAFALYISRVISRLPPSLSRSLARSEGNGESADEAE